MKIEQLEKILSEPWRIVLKPFIESEEFDKIVGYIKERKRLGNIVIPDTEYLFSAFNECPPDKVKVLLLLQDPYNSIKADGKCMSCSLTGRPQPSLVEVHREIRRTVPGYISPQNCDLSYLAQQGILLGNASLTTEWRSPNAHQGLWDPFMSYVFHEVINKIPYPLVYILLGKDAQNAFTKYVRIGDHILTARHPASASYSGGVWDSDGVFVKCNEILKQQGSTPIMW